MNEIFFYIHLNQELNLYHSPHFHQSMCFLAKIPWLGFLYPPRYFILAILLVPERQIYPCDGCKRLRLVLLPFFFVKK